MKNVLICITFLACLSHSARAGTSADATTYLRDIKPLLQERCYACHGALKQKARLRLDTVAAALKGGENGPAVEAGRAAESLLIERITSDDLDSRMPPEGEPLSARQIALLNAWIAAGAIAPADEQPEPDPRQHWAFQPIRRPAVPAGGTAGWVRNPIDAFVAAEHQKRGLSAAPPADKAVLLRRVHLDLVGLPPTRDQLRAYISDNSPDAYERVVDQLLASPQYGERWGRHWMDVWRYSDWYGRRAVPDVMNSYGQIWRWRDWIVRSLNADKGYDRMVVEMLAADEIAPADDANVVATGFIVRNWFKWNYNTWMKDQVEHTGKAFLGLTFNCAHCHDHKYDPVSQEDYFRFRAFFEPLELRHERVPGEPDPGPFKKYVYGAAYGPITSGMVRVFDEKLDAPTFFYTGGDARNKAEGKPPIAPGVPAALGGNLRIEPVNLPPTAWYPGLKPAVQQEEIAKAAAAVATAETALAQANQQLAAAEKAATPATLPGTRPATAPAAVTTTAPAAGPATRSASVALEDARLGVGAAAAELNAARGALLALYARIAADNAKHLPTDEPADRAAVLARAAAAAERQAAHATALAKAARAEHLLLAAKHKVETDPAAQPAATAAEQQAAAARAEVAAAQAALSIESDRYTPLSPSYPGQSTGRRAALARWIATPDNPLTARVAVNHIWLRHFGSAIVETTDNFGRNGKPPSHPQLLDWLAAELMDRGWSMKHLHRLIVTSSTYRMSSNSRPGGGDAAGQLAALANVRSDPDNRYLWHFNTLRMEAEAVRDSVLHLAGDLDATIGGPDIDHRQGLTSRRRSLYFTHHGEEKMQFLDLFDGASASECYRRADTVIPQQALALANSEFSSTYGRVLARKLWEQVKVAAAGAEPAGESAFVIAAFEQVLTRGPTPAEEAACLKFLDVQARAARDAAPAASQPAPAAAAAAAPVVPSADAQMRARESLVHALLNHNDFVTIR